MRIRPSSTSAHIYHPLHHSPQTLLKQKKSYHTSPSLSPLRPHSTSSSESAPPKREEPDSPVLATITNTSTRSAGSSKNHAIVIGDSDSDAVVIDHSPKPRNLKRRIPLTRPDLAADDSDEELPDLKDIKPTPNPGPSRKRKRPGRGSLQAEKVKPASFDGIDLTGVDSDASLSGDTPKPPKRTKQSGWPNTSGLIEITGGLSVERIEDINAIPDVWPVPKGNVAYRLDFTDLLDLLSDSKASKKPSLASLIRSEAQDAWKIHSSGSAKPEGDATAAAGILADGEVKVRRSACLCAGVKVCSESPPDLWQGMKRYEADYDERKKLRMQQLEANAEEEQRNDVTAK